MNEIREYMLFLGHNKDFLVYSRNEGYDAHANVDEHAEATDL